MGLFAYEKPNTVLTLNIIIPSVSSLNRQQRRAYKDIVAFLDPLQVKEKFHRLSGYAGTGKTFLLKVLHHHAGVRHAANCAPTNQATKVIKRMLHASGAFGAECKTIYSLLGVKMVSNEDKMVLEFPAIPADLSGYDVIFVDETSMLNKEMLDYIKAISVRFRTKWLFLGDKAQITPVGERISPIWRLDCGASYLTKVERYDNEILELATHVRIQVTSYPKVDLHLASNHGDKEGVWKYRREAFYKNMQRLAKNGDFSQPEYTVAIAWRNSAVVNMNQVIREAIFTPAMARKHMWLPSDRLVVREPIQEGPAMLAHIGDEGTVLSVDKAHHSIYKELQVYFIVVSIDDGPTIILNVIHEESEALLQHRLNALAMEAKEDRTKWKYFWMMKNSFHAVRHSYSRTAHTVQGATYKIAFVDTADILANSNTREALRCLYVGLTRPTTAAVLT